MAQDNYDREWGIINLNLDNQPLPGQLPEPQPDLQSIDNIDKIRNSLPQGGGVKPVSEMVADMFPGFGELSSAVNIGNDLKNGNYGMAALGLGMFAVPSAARKAGKYIHNPIRRFFNHTGHKIRGVWDKFRYGIQDRIDAFKYYNRYKNKPWDNKGVTTTRINKDWTNGKFPYDIEASANDLQWYNTYDASTNSPRNVQGKAMLQHIHYLRPYEAQASPIFDDRFSWLTGKIDHSTLTERSFRSIFGQGQYVPKDAMLHMEQHVYPSLPHGSVFSADAQNISLGEYMLNAKNGWNAFWRGVFGRPKVHGVTKADKANMWGKSADSEAFYGSFGKPVEDLAKFDRLGRTARMAYRRRNSDPLSAYAAKHSPVNFKTIYTGKAGWFNDASRLDGPNGRVYKAQQAYREGLDFDEFTKTFGFNPTFQQRVGDNKFKIDAYGLVDWLNTNLFKPAGLRRAHVDLHGNPYWYNPAIWRYLKGGKTLNNYGKR